MNQLQFQSMFFHMYVLTKFLDSLLVLGWQILNSLSQVVDLILQLFAHSCKHLDLMLKSKEDAETEIIIFPLIHLD